jgi:uncharacterized membrane protein
MMYGYGNDMTWWMVVYSVLWFVLITLAITAIVVWIRRSVVPVSPASNARHILEERFASGEIDAEKYQRRIRVLPPQPGPGVR